MRSPGERQETVVVIHGTFAGPPGVALDRQRGRFSAPASPGAAPGWNQPGGSFCRRLDRELEELGSEARCWAHLTSPQEWWEHGFYWDGANSRASRLEAARQLEGYLAELADRGWICHVIAHSHGGNVVLETTRRLRQEYAHDDTVDWMIGSESAYSDRQGPGVGRAPLGALVLLGTPILSVDWGERGSASAPAERARTSLWAASAVVWLVALTVAAAWSGRWELPLLPLLGYALAWGAGRAWPLIRLIFIVPLAPFVLIRWFRRRSRRGLEVDPLSVPEQRHDLATRQPKILILSSTKDEAFRLLSNLWSRPNPWRATTHGGRRGAWMRRWRSASQPVQDFARLVRVPGDRWSWLLPAAMLGVAAAAAVAGDAPRWARLYALAGLLTLAGFLAYYFGHTGARRGRSPEELRTVFELAEDLARAMLRHARAALSLPGRLLWPLAMRLWHLAEGQRRILEKAWAYVQQTALGLQDFPLRVSEVSVSQELPPGESELSLSIRLDPEDEANARRKRRRFADNLAPAILGLLDSDNTEIAVGDVDRAWRQLMSEELALLHSAYYTEDGSIRRIAAFLKAGDRGE